MEYRLRQHSDDELGQPFGLYSTFRQTPRARADDSSPLALAPTPTFFLYSDFSELGVTSDYGAYSTFYGGNNVRPVVRTFVSTSSGKALTARLQTLAVVPKPMLNGPEK